MCQHCVEHPVSINHLDLEETRYPLEETGTCTLNVPALRDVWPLLIRAQQINAHETYCDTPYYEQLQYFGDTRLQCLNTYVLSHDDRLAKKAILMGDWSRLSNGLTTSRYPSRHQQIIPPFALWWVCMVHDYAWWRNDPSTVKSVLPGVRAIIERFAIGIDKRGIVSAPIGWQFTDWVKDPAWQHGVPPDNGHNTTSCLQWQFIHAVSAAQQLERHFGNNAYANYYADLTKKILTGVEYFWNERQDLYAIDLDHQYFSEHPNVLALAESLSVAKPSKPINTILV